jgi:Protein kinase domain
VTLGAELASLARLLDRALDLSAESRQAWIDGLGPEHQTLRPLLQKLLEEDDDAQTQDLLARMPQWTRLAIEQRLVGSGAIAAGRKVGPYRLVEPLGRGGMGTVWLAERVDGAVKRHVALKLPFSSAEGQRVAARFERERDILAALEHRHIARLYDAGVAIDGQPYLALERVAGLPITEHCDGERLNLRSRVGLFLQVLEAIQYAHSRLVEPSPEHPPPEHALQAAELREEIAEHRCPRSDRRGREALRRAAAGAARVLPVRRLGARRIAACLGPVRPCRRPTGRGPAALSCAVRRRVAEAAAVRALTPKHEGAPAQACPEGRPDDELTGTASLPAKAARPSRLAPPKVDRHVRLRLDSAHVQFPKPALHATVRS